jgi:predicted RNA methylase
MAKLTRQQAAQHAKALNILENDVLTDEQKELVFINYQEGANNVNSEAGAFFTPLSMALEFAFDAQLDGAYTAIDLCAGIGALSHGLITRNRNIKRLVCVDVNPEYVAVGKKLVPEAEWYCLDLADIEALKALGSFDLAVSNPPFGNVRTFKNSEGAFYTGAHAEYKVIDIAGMLADHGAFIIPQQSAPFKMAGVRSFEYLKDDQLSSKIKAFTKQTNIYLEVGMGMDTSSCLMFEHWVDDVCHKNDWHGVKPVVEFVHVEYPAKYSFEEVEIEDVAAVSTGFVSSVFEPIGASDETQLDMFV